MMKRKMFKRIIGIFLVTAVFNRMHYANFHGDRRVCKARRPKNG